MDEYIKLEIFSYVRNKTIIGLKFHEYFIYWWNHDVRNKTIIGLKYYYIRSKNFYFWKLEIRL